MDFHPWDRVCGAGWHRIDVCVCVSMPTGVHKSCSDKVTLSVLTAYGRGIGAINARLLTKVMSKHTCMSRLVQV